MILNGEEYVESLRGRGLKVHLFGERVAEPVDHPVIRPSINAVARTYDPAIHRNWPRLFLRLPASVSIDSFTWRRARRIW